MRRLFWSSLALGPALGLALIVSPAAGASTSSHRSSPDARAAAAARAALKHVSVGHPSGQRVAGSKHRVKGQTMLDYYNWSGYADDNTASNTYSKVAGDWKEPAITCTNEDEIVVFWVGIDGLTDSTVEQDGTLAQCYEGTAYYYTWWEMYPTNDITVVGGAVLPGDKIAASVSKSGTKYTLKVTDSTTPANSFSTSSTCAKTTCIDTSAEWIAESPSGARGDYPLPDFTSWSLTSASVTSGTQTGKISTFPDDELTMVDSSDSYALTEPGSLNGSGNAFTVTWEDSY